MRACKKWIIPGSISLLHKKQLIFKIVLFKSKQISHFLSISVLSIPRNISQVSMLHEYQVILCVTWFDLLLFLRQYSILHENCVLIHRHYIRTRTFFYNYSFIRFAHVLVTLVHVWNSTNKRSKSKQIITSPRENNTGTTSKIMSNNWSDECSCMTLNLCQYSWTILP